MIADSRYILNTLLDKYEESPFARGGTSRQSVKIRCATDSVIKASLEDVAAKEAFFSSLDTLSEEGFISYTTEKYQIAKIVNHIILNIDNVERAYDYIGRTPLYIKTASLINLLNSASIQNEELHELVEEMKEDVALKQKLIHPFNQGIKHSEDILKVLEYISTSSESILERIMSTKLFGDSKYFEKKLKSDLISFLKPLRPDTPADNILPSFGIVRYPEVIEFTGNIKTPAVDYSPLVNGAYINSRDIESLESVCIDAKMVITIENKANYYSYIKTRNPDELVIYSAGFPSPALMKLLSLIYKSSDDKIVFYHSGDIDLGGFMIFNSIRKAVPTLKPYKMDIGTLEENMVHAMPITDSQYLEKLEVLLNDREFSVFHDVIFLMLADKVRLEQESLLIT